VDWVLTKLLETGMRVSQENSKFFKKSVEHLGFIVSQGGLRTSPEKVKAIRQFPPPITLYELRSFLGLASYYRCFTKNFAAIATPLTSILKGNNGKTSKYQSRKVDVDMTKEQRETFDRLREILASENVLLSYPDFKRLFDLTTDASGFGLGAVLSQDGRPFTMISRDLRDNEQNYTTNERELLAIVWALKNLRNYLFGVKSLQIFTDHQPLTFAVSDKSPNAKLKRWKGIIDYHGAKLVYKPGKEIHVADALSRQNINVLEEEIESDVASYTANKHK